MDKNEFLSKIQEIGTCEDDATQRALLSELSNDVSAVYDEIDTLRSDNKQMTADMETLRSANMKLFQQVGIQKSPEDIAHDKGEPTPPPEKRSFNNLFDEKGNIK